MAEMEQALADTRNMLEHAKIADPESRKFVEHLTEDERFELARMITRYEELTAEAQKRAVIAKNP